MPHFKPPRRTHSFELLACALVGALLWAPGALAADLDPGYADVPPPIPQQVVSFGSGWYIRGDIAALEDYKVDVKDTSIIKRTHDLGFDASVGGGYAFTNNIRSDLTADFFQPTQSCTGMSGGCNTIGQFQRYAALANGYYDIGQWSIVTPYIGAGVGAVFGNKNIGYGAVKYTNFAWALMAGLAFDVYQHVKIDIGYRYLNGGTVFGATLYDHEIRAGVRYMIDN